MKPTTISPEIKAAALQVACKLVIEVSRQNETKGDLGEQTIEVYQQIIDKIPVNYG